MSGDPCEPVQQQAARYYAQRTEHILGTSGDSTSQDNHNKENK